MPLGMLWKYVACVEFVDKWENTEMFVLHPVFFFKAVNAGQRDMV